MDRTLALTLLEGFAAEFEGGNLPIRSRKAQALLAYLAIGGPTVQSREKVCGLFWSESSEEKARASLRQLLHGLREDLQRTETPILIAGRESIGLAHGTWRTDATDLLTRLSADEVDERVVSRKRLADALLPGFEDLDPAFRIWVLVQRQALQEQLTRALERLLTDHSAGLVRDAARALLNLDPTHEGACRLLMQDFAVQGDIAAALKVYKQLWDLLDDEYGTEPSDQTQELVVRIKNNEVHPATDDKATRGSPPPQQPASDAPFLVGDHVYLSIAAFDGFTDERHSHLVQGLRMELIAKLVRFREWSVIDAGVSVEAPQTLPGRRYVVSGFLRQLDDELSLTMTVKDATGRYVWSESFVLVPERRLAFEQVLIRRIATALNVHLSSERIMRTAPMADISLGAHDRWLRGQQELLSFGADSADRSEALFASIIAEAPHFSPAFSGLAQLRNARHLAMPGLQRSPDLAESALQLANRAVQNDPFDTRAHLAHGWALALNGVWDQAELSFGMALQLNDNDPWTLTSTALALAFCGQHDTSIDVAEQALLLIPQPSRVHWAYQATLRFVCRDYAGCVAAAERSSHAISNVSGWQAAAFAHLGEIEMARRAGAAFLTSIRERWHGGDPTDERIAAWFLGAFPIRLDADHDRLRDGLMSAIGPVSPTV